MGPRVSTGPKCPRSSFFWGWGDANVGSSYQEADSDMHRGSAFLASEIPQARPLNVLASSSLSVDFNNLHFSDFLEQKLLGDIFGWV